MSSRSRKSGFSMVEMIGVLAIIAILAVVIVPRVFSTIASSKITSAASSVNALKASVAEFAAKYGTIPVTNANSRIDDLLLTAGMLESRFAVKIGTQPTATPPVAATWSNTTGTWVAAGGANQGNVSRIICVAANPAAVPGTGTNYQITGDAALNVPAGSNIVSAVVMQVPLNEARELSLRIDGVPLSQPENDTNPDTRGRVVYAGAGTGLRNVYVYLVHQ